MQSDPAFYPHFPYKHYSANVLMVLRSVIHTYDLIYICIKQINRCS